MILSYCMNVHPGETLEELLALLRGPAARVRNRWRGERDMGAGLWLPLACARAIAENDDAADQTRAALAEAGLFAYTVNAFPIGDFHTERVKERVYQPDWTQRARLDYTLLACRALARLLPDGARGSVSTVPIGFKSAGFKSAGFKSAGFKSAGLKSAGSKETTEPFVAAGVNLARLALELAKLEDETGHELSLALEPEPLATLETTPETIAFLEDHVFGGAGRQVLEKAGRTAESAEAELRRRIGVCVDSCHLACEFETLSTSVAALAKAGVRVVKAQLSSALEIANPADDAAGLRRLLAFAEPRYLHQSIGRLPDGSLVSALDLPDLAPDGVLSAAFATAQTVRTHFHVPLSWAGDGQLRTTRPALEEGLAAIAAATDHLEVETYTFDVLPAEQRARYGDDVVNMIAEELAWAETALG